MLTYAWRLPVDFTQNVHLFCRPIDAVIDGGGVVWAWWMSGSGISEGISEGGPINRFTPRHLYIS